MTSQHVVWLHNSSSMHVHSISKPGFNMVFWEGYARIVAMSLFANRYQKITVLISLILLSELWVWQFKRSKSFNGLKYRLFDGSGWFLLAGFWRCVRNTLYVVYWRGLTWRESGEEFFRLNSQCESVVHFFFGFVYVTWCDVTLILLHLIWRHYTWYDVTTRGMTSQLVLWRHNT